jgi:hypothetical protein
MSPPFAGARWRTAIGTQIWDCEFNKGSLPLAGAAVRNETESPVGGFPHSPKFCRRVFPARSSTKLANAASKLLAQHQCENIAGSMERRCFCGREFSGATPPLQSKCVVAAIIVAAIAAYIDDRQISAQVPFLILTLLITMSSFGLAIWFGWQLRSVDWVEST